LVTVSAVTGPPVVVGLDPSDASVGALVWAAEEAAAHRAPLVALYVLDPRGTEAVYAQTGERSHLAPDEAVDRVKELIDKAGVGPLEHVFETGVPGRVLVHRSRGARMLVLGQGTHHHQGAGGAYRPGPSLGAVARACVAFAECPVVIVPERLADLTAARTAALELHDALHGGRAIYPFQGRLPVAHQ
jgi:nucleotide-binding universal stress UspA family protein